MASYYEPDSILVVLLHTVRDGSGCEARRCERGEKAFPLLLLVAIIRCHSGSSLYIYRVLLSV